MQASFLKVNIIDVCNFQFTATTGLDIFSNADYFVVIKIQAGNSKIRFWLTWLLLYTDGTLILIKLHYAIPLRVIDMIGKHHAPIRIRMRFQNILQSCTIEYIVTQNQSNLLFAYKFLSDDKGLSKSFRLGLYRKFKMAAHLTAITQQFLECSRVFRGGDNENLPDSGHHQYRQRVINHRLIVNRHKLLTYSNCQGVKTCARATG